MIEQAYERFTPLDDIAIRSDGNGRVIDAYAAIFGARQEIRDQDGHYVEVIHPYAFQRTLEQRAGRFQVLYNHGRSMYGTPSDRYSMPYGTIEEIRADSRGLLTSVKVAATPLGDEILELVRDGALKGMSFSGTFIRSDTLPDDILTGLRTIERVEISLREFGVTPFPAYPDAQVQLVRTAFDHIAQLPADEIAEALAQLPDTVRADVARALAPPDPRDGTDSSPDPRDGLGHQQHQLALKVRLQGIRLPQEKP